MSKVISVHPQGSARVINLTVNKNHTFITANGIITHNCDGAAISLQSGLKSFLELFSANCRFILTANNKHKIIDPIRSRCTEIDFTMQGDEKPKLAAGFYRRVADILALENVTAEPKVVAKLVERNFPDFRKTLNELQRHAANGNIDASALIDHAADSYKELTTALKARDFKTVRSWLGKNQDVDLTVLSREIYNTALTQMKDASIPGLILILADYGYKSAFCADQQINAAACMVEIMSGCEWNV